MEWTLRLVGTGVDGQSRSFDVMVVSRPDGLDDIANLGLTLAEAKQLLVQVQQEVALVHFDRGRVVGCLSLSGPDHPDAAQTQCRSPPPHSEGDF
jgi:septum formation inhibitor-activating ATPase MinD